MIQIDVFSLDLEKKSKLSFKMERKGEGKERTKSKLEERMR